MQQKVGGRAEKFSRLGGELCHGIQRISLKTERTGQLKKKRGGVTLNAYELRARVVQFNWRKDWKRNRTIRWLHTLGTCW